MNFIASLAGILSGTMTLSGSITFEGTLSELITAHSASQIQLITADFNGNPGNVLFFPFIERSIFDVEEVIMIMSANDGVENHGSTNFIVFDQAIFGEDIQEFVQPTIIQQPGIASSNSTSVWVMTGSQSLHVTSSVSDDLSWNTQGMYSGWFYWDGQGDDTMFVCRNGAGYRIAAGMNGALGLNIWTDGTTNVYNTPMLTSSSWHYIECIVDCKQSTPSDRMKLFIDREFKSPDSIVGLDWTTSLPDPSSFEFGINYENNYWHGKMGNFYVCNEIPVDEDRDIIANYQRPVTGSF